LLLDAGERARYVPPPCPVCGHAETAVEWTHFEADGIDLWCPLTFACPMCHGVKGYRRDV